MNVKVKARVEQIKQASQIHGGMANMWAAAVGVKLSRLPIPSRKVRERLFRTLYGKRYQALCEDELVQPLADYRSLNALFTHGVRPEYRPLPQSKEDLLCPCDGTIQDLGELKNDTLLTAKGIEYSLGSLLPGIEVDSFVNGNFTIFFLSPADCHRVFSPQQALLKEVVHVPGRRLLVHPPYQRKEFPVFSLNERVVMRLETNFGSVLMVLVAGWGVGNITYPFKARYRTNRRQIFPIPRSKTKKIHPHKRVRMSKRKITHAKFEHPVSLERGEWIATFELGSTVILITPPQENIVTHYKRDEKVHYGQSAYSFLKDGNSTDNGNTDL